MGVLTNPFADEALSAEERKFAQQLLHTYGQMVRQGEEMFANFCSGRGVPEAVFRKVAIQILLHRCGTLAAHELAETLADDMIVADEASTLCERLKKVVADQIPLSRETVERIGPRP